MFCSKKSFTLINKFEFIKIKFEPYLIVVVKFML